MMTIGDIGRYSDDSFEFRCSQWTSLDGPVVDFEHLWLLPSLITLRLSSSDALALFAHQLHQTAYSINWRGINGALGLSWHLHLIVSMVLFIDDHWCLIDRRPSWFGPLCCFWTIIWPTVDLHWPRCWSFGYQNRHTALVVVTLVSRTEKSDQAKPLTICTLDFFSILLDQEYLGLAVPCSNPTIAPATVNSYFQFFFFSINESVLLYSIIFPSSI